MDGNFNKLCYQLQEVDKKMAVTKGDMKSVGRRIGVINVYVLQYILREITPFTHTLDNFAAKLRELAALICVKENRKMAAEANLFCMDGWMTWPLIGLI